MNKIEYIATGTKATVVVNGVTSQVFLGQHLTDEQLATVRISEGAIKYTVDEGESRTLKPVAVKPKVSVPTNKAGLGSTITK